MWMQDYQKMMGHDKLSAERIAKGREIVRVEHKGGKQFELTPDPFAWQTRMNSGNKCQHEKDKIEHLYLIGGEPMMIQRHFKFLKECVESAIASISFYNTTRT